MMRALLAALVLAATAVTDASARSNVKHSVLTFDDLVGWESDDHSAALQVFLNTCGDMKTPEWTSLCALGKTQSNAKTFFELFFRPVLVQDGVPALFTGYFEPELNGSRTRYGKYQFPLYRAPPELRPGQLWFSRSVIEKDEILAGRGLEIAWIDNPVDVFFLQVQGSGRVRLTDGTSLRVGYGGANGRPYKSIGEELVRRGVYQPHQVSAQVIRNWVERNPTAGTDLLRFNPSYVFFREVNEVPLDKGPLGAMNRSITTERTIAVDPRFVPLGAPVWIEKGGRGRINRLMVAQDTGSAIKGAQRADIFLGTGNDAGRAAGKIRDPGRMVVLMPIEEAYAKAEGIFE